MKALLQKILSKSLIVKLRSFINRVDERIYPFFAKNRYLSSVYFCFFSAQFHREHKAVLAGRLKYQQSLNEINQSSVLLRRNTHRLEKGLIMQPRRPIFAEAYIAETVDCYVKCLTSDSLCTDELKWGYDVLSRYFEIVSNSNVIDNARAKFNALTHKSDNAVSNEDVDGVNDGASLPYRHDQRVTSDITTEQLHNLFKQRRSVRWYQQKMVEKDVIEQAVSLASLAPSACNRQPFEFHVITDMDKASEVAATAMGTTGFSDNIPALIAVVGDLSAYPAERDRHVIYIDGGLASMQLMLAFETLGLSTCPINWPDVEICEKKITKKLKLSFHHRPIMLMAVGYAEPDGCIPFSQKKSHKLLIKEVS